MSLKTYHGESVWVPENVTLIQRLALRPLTLSTGVVTTGAIVAVVGLFLTFQISSACALIFFSGMVVFLLGTIMGILLDRLRTLLQNDHAFRFPSMTSRTLSFDILELFGLARIESLTSAQRQAIDNWLEAHWIRDSNLSPLASNRELYLQISERTASFQSLPLDLPEDFASRADKLVADYRDRYAARLASDILGLKQDLKTLPEKIAAREREFAELQQPATGREG